MKFKWYYLLALPLLGGSASTPTKSRARLISAPGAKSRVKKRRNFAGPQFIQIHQTDYRAGDSTNPSAYRNMKTNYAVTDDDQILLIHPVEEVIIDNYDDLVHIEVSGVFYGEEGNEKTLNRIVYDDNGKKHVRKPTKWTASKEAALEKAMEHAYYALQAKGVTPAFIFHRQTWEERANDPGQSIARAAQRIARRRGWKVDLGLVRGSGKTLPLHWRL
jgi:hypothetical protein